MTKEQIVVGMAESLGGARVVLTAEELGVTFDPVPAHTKGVGSYGGDEVPRQERPTPLPAGPGGGKRRRRRRGGRRGGGGGGGGQPAQRTPRTTKAASSRRPSRSARPGRPHSAPR